MSGKISGKLTELMINVRDSTLNDKFCEDFCIYDCDKCEGECFKGVKLRLEKDGV